MHRRVYTMDLRVVGASPTSGRKARVAQVEQQGRKTVDSATPFVAGPGRVAQQSERLPYKQDVVGANPTVPILECH